MEIKRYAKRLFALGTGALMLGATAMGAMAADLKDYPAFLVKDGSFNGYMVVGENAKPIDNLAMTDIAAGMKYKKAAETATTTVSGDAWKVGTSSKFYEMSDNGAPLYENFKDIVSYISEDELKALGSGIFSTGEKDYTSNQYMYFDTTAATNNGVVKYVENGDTDVTADFLYFANGGQIARYKMEFTSPTESDVASDLSGTASTSGTYLSDLDSKKISFLGKEYTIVLATRPSSGKEDSVKLLLMGGATSDSITEGEEKTYTLSGKEYKIKLSYVDTDEAKFIVNGEATDKMQTGQTKKLSDGKEIGVSEILYQEYAGGVHSAVFFLGASKIELRDDLITDALSDTELVVGSDTIDGANVIITGTDNNVTSKISTIEVNMTAEDDFYVPANGKLSDVIAVEEEKEVLFTNNWDIEYKGLSTEKTHDLKLGTSTDRRYVLTWYDGDNNKVDMPLAYAESYTNTTHQGMTLGEESDDKVTILNESVAIAKNDYFVLTTAGTDVSATAGKGEEKSYLLQYKGSDDTDKSSPKIKFKNMGGGDLEYSVDTSANPRATIKLGGYSFIVNNASGTSAGDDWTIKVALNGDSDVTDPDLVGIRDYYGGRIAVTDNTGTNSAAANASNIVLSIDTPGTNDYDSSNGVPEVLTISVNSDTEVRAAQSGYTLITPEGQSDVGYGYTAMGTKITFEEPSGSPDKWTYAYPEEQVLPQVYVTSGAVTTATSTDGTWTPVAIVDATKLDSEVADYKAQNLIVVGGPCVNTVAASLLGNPAECASGFTAGVGLVKLFENGDKVAMLVAGYSGDDTRAAGKFVANKWKDLTGKEVNIETASGSITTVAKVEVAAPVVATVPATE
jgi:hypothetical protein